MLRLGSSRSAGYTGAVSRTSSTSAVRAAPLKSVLYSSAAHLSSWEDSKCSSAAIQQSTPKLRQSAGEAGGRRGMPHPTAGGAGAGVRGLPRA